MNIMSSDPPGKFSLDSRLSRIAGLGICLALVGIILYSSIVPELFSSVLRREGSSHGVFVPLLSLYFLWRKRAELKWRTYELERKLEKYIESEITERVKTISKRSKKHKDLPDYK